MGGHGLDAGLGQLVCHCVGWTVLGGASLCQGVGQWVLVTGHLVTGLRGHWGGGHATGQALAAPGLH